MSIHMAIASSIFTIFFSSIASAVTFTYMGEIDFVVGIAYSIGMVIGFIRGATMVTLPSYIPALTDRGTSIVIHTG